ILLLVVPAVSAVVVAMLGHGRAQAIRLVSLAAVILDLILAAVLTIGFIDARDERPISQDKDRVATFRPEIVPGADFARDIHKTTWRFLSFGNLGAVQFYLGLDGLNIWLIVLT